ncbi:restriction endonuclease subunit S [Pseudooceanicola sp. CBS1P-1]|uniref:Type I restriction modification DNA specificity domain-containing protein n=1 Tax=Pseudooceanicola albus TaxID=2692189 RepID=A0A6L7GAJ6_9RHOB|nr:MULTISPECIES: restriction endonuclease subunit S [Pseudooceanicola]MBT9386935.1 restriction endonuclease subunit S [Pseudooceanicola endophyticus]MXN21061.1 hypothetical protein [Pseudooceanicola albus]
MSELPQGWSQSTLAEVAKDISYGFTTSAADSEENPKLLRITDVQDYSVEWSDVPFCKDAPPEDKLLSSGDIVIARTGATTGKSYLLSEIPTATAFASYLIRVRSSDAVDPEYLWKFMWSPDYWRQITVVSKGTAQPGANASILGGLELPIPPLPEQRRIVAKLDRLSARSAAARDHLARTTKLATRAKQAILSSAFDPALHEVVVQVSEIAERVTKGASPKWQGFDYQPEGILFVRSQNVGWGSLLLDEKAFLDEGFNAKQKNSVIQQDDVLLNIVGASIGRTAVATAEIQGANCNQAVAVIRLLAPNRIDSRFLNLWLQSPAAQDLITDGSVDVARANFSLASIKALALPWPKQSERSEIVRRIEAAFARIDRLTEEASRAAHLLDRLDERLLAKAFRGELVPQDPEDEPAEALLARIRQSRASAPKAKRGRKKVQA